MQAPKFWNKPVGLMATILFPLGALYGWATARRLRQSGAFQADVPVICVGNINVGGTGKTPTTIALAQYFSERGLRAFVVSRGYGAKITSTTEVDPRRHTADDTGDEPLLMAGFTRTWVTPSRADGIKAAQDAGANVVLIDDGFQDPSFTKDLSFVVTDAQRGFGNGLCLPAGPLREPANKGLARADAVIVVGPDPVNANFLKTLARQNKPVIRARLRPLETGMDWQDQRFFAFAGIGHPEKFYSTLRELGAVIVATENLDDHQRLSRALVTRLLERANALGAQLVTTEKDAARLPAEFNGQVLSLPVRLQFDDQNALDSALLPILSN